MRTFFFISLIFISFSFQDSKISESHFHGGTIGWVMIDGVEYQFCYNSSANVDHVHWHINNYHYIQFDIIGTVYSNPLLSVDVEFEGPNGLVVYDGQVYQNP